MNKLKQFHYQGQVVNKYIFRNKKKLVDYEYDYEYYSKKLEKQHFPEKLLKSNAQRKHRE